MIKQAVLIVVLCCFGACSAFVNPFIDSEPMYNLPIGKGPGPNDDPCDDKWLNYYVKLYFETIEHGNKIKYYQSKEAMEIIQEADLLKKCPDKLVAKLRKYDRLSIYNHAA